MRKFNDPLPYVSDNASLLSQISPLRIKLMLLNAHSQLHKKYRGKPLWAFVSDITGHGSTYSVAICKECGWDAHKDASLRIEWGTNPKATP